MDCLINLVKCQKIKSKIGYFLILVVSIGLELPQISLAQEQPKPVQDFGYWAGLCSGQNQAKNYEEAIKACQQAIAINPNEPKVWTDLGNAQFSLTKYVEAVGAFGQVIRIEAKIAEAWAKRCAGRIELGGYEEAISDCETALKLPVDESWGKVTPAFALYHQGIAQWRLARRDEALFSFDLATQSNPNYSIAWADRCLLLSQMGRTYEALGSCDRALAVNGDWENKTAAFAWTNKGRVLAKLEKYDEALTSYDKALAINPKDEVAWTEQGAVLEKLGKLGEALASQEWALKISPNYALALANKCSTLNRQKNYKDAIKDCDKAIQEGDGRWGEEGIALAWNHRANALTGVGSFEDALASANRAIAISPNYPDPWINRGVTLWYLGRFDEALGATSQAILLNPNSSPAWFNLGRILTTLGKYQDALDAYDRALLGDANVGDRLTLAQIWVNKSALLWRLERYQEAIASADNAIGINRKSSQAWYNKGLALMALNCFNCYGEAAAAYEEAIKIDPKNADFWTGKGIALRFLERYPEALVALQTALKLNPSQPQALANQQFVILKLQPPPGQLVPPPSPSITPN
ncbi:MAG TPA: hypothetical protein DEG17_07050 [Cyanobacteria bacterium UBA11149]|nr:hypothetical protein [Cyanobacteria bacterium UBA11367]HBE59414.1 hypothetical protein [Cyanobacteria bacterium UBA11366]HBK64855.1 hypothetical protein [Cyanobacteria bacterium UBA11166]HBR74921.1 hypothetical protein [Cyanobacteria bacterium UBA11159]HBS69468.1 hypothetical protein [Cyanobacteria bacterium UBA11153]HBW88623.1 hypothetical protein [Cyanobacteria bacterium UBA11149]HCA97104.1 hypothetical protein [Cyanobacteria bacterium UBA9226]